MRIDFPTGHNEARAVLEKRYGRNFTFQGIRREFNGLSYEDELNLHYKGGGVYRNPLTNECEYVAP